VQPTEILFAEQREEKSTSRAISDFGLFPFTGTHLFSGAPAGTLTMLTDQGHNAFQLPFQRCFNRVGLTLSTGHTADVGRIDFELASDPAIKAADQRS
jgi:hypothetical protein